MDRPSDPSVLRAAASPRHRLSLAPLLERATFAELCTKAPWEPGSWLCR